MNVKRTVGIVISIIGIAFILISFYAMKKVSSAEGTAHAVEDVFSKNPAAKMVGERVNEKIDNYRILAQRCLFGGIILVVVGGVTVVVCRKHKRKR